jgi:hypothetical protein
LDFAAQTDDQKCLHLPEKGRRKTGVANARVIGPQIGQKDVGPMIENATGIGHGVGVTSDIGLEAEAATGRKEDLGEWK